MMSSSVPPPPLERHAHVNSTPHFSDAHLPASVGPPTVPRLWGGEGGGAGEGGEGGRL